MKNEMPDEIWAGFGWDQKVLSAGAWYSEPLKDHQHRYTKADLTDRRADVDALIRLAERVFYEHGETVNMNSNDDLADKLWEAIQAIRDARE